MELEQVMAWVGFATALGRAVLVVLDLLDDKIPALKPATDALGTLLGGKKARYSDGE